MTRPPSPTPSQLPPIPPSRAASYASSTNTAPNMSAYNLPPPPPPPPTSHAVLTKSDLAASQSAYATLLTTAKAYRLALAALASAASAFGASLEACARLKEARADSLLPPLLSTHHGVHHHAQPSSNTANPATTSSTCTADALLATAGVQHLVANHKHILSETLYRAFEVPLLHELDKWRRAVDDENANYTTALAARSTEIRRLERDGLKLHRQRGPRDVAAFRGHLVDLTCRLDGLTALHGEHARALLRESQDTSVRIVEASCSLVRAEVDIFESLARKGWSGGGLDEILEKGVDLFAADEHNVDDGSGGAGGGGVGGGGGGSTKLFTILPPGISILADSSDSEMLRGRSPGFTAAGGGGEEGKGGGGLGGGHHHHHGRADSLGVSSEPAYQSLTGAVTTSASSDAASIFSADFNAGGRPRMTRPFSPRPVKVAPEDVMGSEGVGLPPPPPPAGLEKEDGGGDGVDTDSEGDASSSSPVTVKDEVGGGGGYEDERAWETGSEGADKRMSMAASDPGERERRWEAGGGEDETD